MKEPLDSCQAPKSTQVTDLSVHRGVRIGLHWLPGSSVVLRLGEGQSGECRGCCTWCGKFQDRKAVVHMAAHTWGGLGPLCRSFGSGVCVQACPWRAEEAPVSCLALPSPASPSPQCLTLRQHRAGPGGACPWWSCAGHPGLILGMDTCPCTWIQAGSLPSPWGVYMSENILGNLAFVSHVAASGPHRFRGV